MKIASWNINSVRRRASLVVDWLERFAPDALLLQETKCEADKFPYTVFAAAGYHAEVVGEKSYNGVAVLTRDPVEVRARALPHEESGAARYLEVAAGDVILASLYLPNGNPWEDGRGEKFLYKLHWMSALAAHAEALLREEKAVILGGDYNIIPTARDCLNADAWREDALFQPQSRHFFRGLLNRGWMDALDDLATGVRRAPETAPWTYWSYQGGAFAADDGIRIDHLLLSPRAADQLVESGIDRGPRAHKDASDHAPVWCMLEPPVARARRNPARATDRVVRPSSAKQNEKKRGRVDASATR